jgi:hypothetical protein
MRKRINTPCKTAYNGYTRFYIGERSGDYNNTLTVNSGYTTSEPVTLTRGEYFIAMTAVNSRGEESRLSNEVRLTIP